MSEAEKLILVEGIVKLLERKDMSINRRIYKWLFGGDVDNEIVIDDSNRVSVGIMFQALKRLFQNRDNSSLEEAIMPIKILQNVFIEHEELIEPILKELAADFIRFFYENSQKTKKASFASDVYQNGLKLLDSISDYFSVLLEAFRAQIITSETDKLGTMKMLIFLIDSLLKNQTNDTKKRALNLRMGLVGILSQLSQLRLRFFHELDNQSIELVRLGTSSVRNLIFLLKETTKDNEHLRKETCSDENFVANLVTFTDHLTEMLLCFNESEKIKNVVEMEQIFKDSLDLLISSYDYTQFLQPLEEGELPDWLKEICCLMNKNPPKLGLLSLVYLLDIMMKGRQASDREIMGEIRSPTEGKELAKIEGKELAKIEEMPLQAEEESNLWSRIRETLLNKDLNNTFDFNLQEQMAILAWNNMACSTTDKLSVRILLRLSDNCMPVLSAHISKQLNLPSIEESDENFRAAAKFWNLIQNEQTESCSNIRKEIVFEMLRFISSESPLHRYSSKNWLVKSVPRLSCIVDPLFEELFLTSRWDIRGNKVYTSDFDTNAVYESFKYLKDMLIVMGEAFILYLSDVFSSSKITSYASSLLKEKKLEGNENIPYLDLLSVICLRYIQATPLDHNDRTFETGNLTVRGSACEFLEMVLSKIRDEDLLRQIASYLLTPTTEVLLSSARSGENGIIIQLISLLRLILFEAHLEKSKKFVTTIITHLQSDLFVGALILGLSSKIIYILTEFRNFVNTTLKLSSELIRHPNLTLLVRKMLSAYYDMIKSRAAITDGTDSEQSEDSPERDSPTNQQCLMILIEGLEYIQQLFVGTDNIMSSNTSDSSNNNILISFLTLGLANTRSKKQEADESFFKNNEDVGKSILNEMGTQLDAFSFCWDRTHAYNEVVNFTSRGCNPFEMDDLKAYVVDSFSARLSEINTKIIQIIRPFAKRFTKNLITELLQYWLISFREEPSSEKNGYSTMRLRDLIEIISESQLNPAEFLKALAKTDIVSAIEKNNSGLRKKVSKNKKVEMSLMHAQRECRILYFLYNYLKFMKINYAEKTEIRNEKSVVIWIFTLRILRMFGNSINITTCFWILETISLLSSKFNFGNVMNQVGAEAHKLLVEELQFVSGFASHKYVVSMRDLANNGGDITPLCPTIYEIQQRFSGQKLILSDLKTQIPATILRTEFSVVGECTDKYRYQCFKVLSSFVQCPVFKLSNNIKTEKLIQKVRSTVDNLFPLFTKSNRNFMYAECASEVISCLFSKQGNKYMVRDLKREVFDVYNMDEFFRCTPNTLKSWAKIIDLTLTYSKEDILETYLHKVNFSSLFARRDVETKTRIKSFERVCFIIFSGEVDKYMTKTKIKALLEQIKDVIKDEKAHTSLLILILFCLRVLILRLSSHNLNELFRNIWPILLTLLVVYLLIRSKF